MPQADGRARAKFLPSEAHEIAFRVRKISGLGYVTLKRNLVIPCTRAAHLSLWLLRQEEPGVEV